MQKIYIVVYNASTETFRLAYRDTTSPRDVYFDDVSIPAFLDEETANRIASALNTTQA